jgi:DNA repair protein RecO (recombination protein O)
VSQLYRDQGIVLRTWKLGEADRILNIMTRGRGKVRAVAKGVRKTTSRFGGRLEPTAHVALQLHQGRSDLQIVTQVESLDQFEPFRADPDRFAGASAMLEATDQVAQEGEPNREVYQLLLGALRALAGPGGALVVPAFFLKLLALEGLRPVVDRCVSCGAGAGDPSVALVAYSDMDGGVLCASCRRGVAISPEALDLLRLVLGGRLGEALASPVGPATFEVAGLATSAMEHHLERRLRSVGSVGHP